MNPKSPVYKPYEIIHLLRLVLVALDKPITIATASEVIEYGEDE
jgi:hypothetical protein